MDSDSLLGSKEMIFILYYYSLNFVFIHWWRGKESNCNILIDAYWEIWVSQYYFIWLSLIYFLGTAFLTDCILTTYKRSIIFINWFII